MIIIPKRETKIVSQLNRSKILGDLWASFNLDLQSNLGVIKVSPRLKIADDSNQTSNLGLAVAFRDFDTKIFTIAGTRVFKADSISSSFSEDTDSGAKTTYDSRWSDMEVFNSQLFTTTNDELMSKAPNSSGTGAWTERDSAFSDETTPHFLCYFKKYNRLYYNDGDFLASIDNTYTVATSGPYTVDLNLDDSEVISCVEATENAIFIGTVRHGNTEVDFRGNVYEWDGISTDVTAKYELDSSGALAMVIKGNIPYIMDSRGGLLKFSGFDFEEIGRLPRSNILPYNLNTNDNDKWIHPNGFITTENNTFLVLVNNLLGDNTGSILENFPSGVWEWSASNGFIHKYSPTYTTSSTITDYGQNRISEVGALASMNKYSTSSSRNGQYVCGATYYTDASSTLNGIFYDDSNNTLQKYGYFVTSFIPSQGLKDTWQKIAVRFRQLLDSEDEIVVKYRTREADPIYVDITWNDTSSFHCTTDLSSYVGYEVEVLQGVGSGKCFHISSVSGNNPWKANLDDVLTGATGTAKVRLQNWKKVISVTNQTSESDIKTLPTVKSERIQVKVCLQFKGDDELHELIIINQTDTILQ